MTAVRAPRLVAKPSSAAVLLAGARQQARTIVESPFIVVAGVVQPAVLTAMTLLAAEGRGLDSSAVGLGSGLIALWGVTVWTAGQILRRELWQGTLAAILMRPVDLRLVLAGKCLGGTIVAVTAISLSVGVTSLLVGEPLRVGSPLAFGATLLATIVAAGVLGMGMNSLFLLSRAAPRIAEAILYPVFILGGLLVPLELLPALVRPLAWALPLYWGGELLRDAAAGSPQAWSDWAALGSTTALYGLLGRVAFTRVLERARKAGTIDLY